jgi:hypothetical protein
MKKLAARVCRILRYTGLLRFFRKARAARHRTASAFRGAVRALALIGALILRRASQFRARANGIFVFCSYGPASKPFSTAPAPPLVRA